MMKKRMWIMTMMLLCVLMVNGCKGKESPDTETDPVEWVKTEPDDIGQNHTENIRDGYEEEYPQMSSESITTLCRNINSKIRQVGPDGNMAVTNLGMYYADQVVLEGGESAYEMMYFDFSSGENVVVCSNASCLHQDRSCEAIYAPELVEKTEEGVLVSGIKVSPLGVYEDKLYVMVSEQIDSMLRLYVSDLSGHNREMLWEISYPEENVTDRMILADSVIWNGSKVYVNYVSEDHIVRKEKVLDSKTQTYMDVYADCVAMPESGILCIDLSDGTGPVQVCEEGAGFFFDETNAEKPTMYVLDQGNVVMMAAKDGVVYYRHLHTDERLDSTAYLADPSSYKTNWNNTFTTRIMRAEIQQGQAAVQEVLELDGGRSAYSDENIYYIAQGQVWRYDLTDGQSEAVIPLEEGTELECVTKDYLVLRNYLDQKMFFVNLDTKDVVEKKAELGCNLYGEVALDGEAYWFLRSVESSGGDRVTLWYLVSPEDYLTQANAHRILVYERNQAG